MRAQYIKKHTQKKRNEESKTEGRDKYDLGVLLHVSHPYHHPLHVIM